MYEGNLVRLRGFRLEDVKIFLDNWNNYELRRFLDDRLPHSKEEEECWVERTWEDMRSGKTMPLSWNLFAIGNSSAEQGFMPSIQSLTVHFSE